VRAVAAGAGYFTVEPSGEADRDGVDLTVMAHTATDMRPPALTSTRWR